MYMTYRAAKYLVDARGHCQLSVRSLQDGVLGAAAACPCVGPPSESALGANGGTAEAPGGSMMRMGGAPSHPDGESLVNLIERCLHFQADYGKEAAQKLSDDERDARRAARKTELAQAAKIAAQCVNDTRLSIYHRGLGARLLACALSQPEASPKLAEQAQESAVHLLDIMNQSSSGITRDHGPVRLSPVDRHRVGVNCAAALAHVHAAASGRSAAQMRGNIQHLDANIMCMSPLPEAFSLESEEDLADQRRRIADAVLRHARYGGSHLG